MGRDKKGKPIPYHLKDYCVLDFETTGPFVKYARIVEVGLLKVRGGKVVDRYDKLVHPGNNVWIPKSATDVHHITNDMVKDAPHLDDVLDEITEFIGDDVIVGYNSAAYDMNILYDAGMVLRNRPLTNDYVDVYHAVRRTLKDALPDCKLETVSKYYGLPTDNNHCAATDCSLTKICYDRLYRDFGHQAFVPRGYGDKSVNRAQTEIFIQEEGSEPGKGLQYE